jgi:heptosyltransferase-2
MSLSAVRQLLRSQTPFDVGVIFPNSLRSALELWLGGVPRRVGYAGHQRRWLLQQVVTPPLRLGPPPHQVEHYLDLARSLGADAEPGEIATAAPAVRH